MTRVSDSVKSEFASVTGSQVMLLLLVWQPDLENLEGSSPPADKGGKNPCGCRCGPEVAHTRYFDRASFCQSSVTWPQVTARIRVGGVRASKCSSSVGGQGRLHHAGII